jgi:hypothetical protein
MSYSPKDERRVRLEVDQSENGMLNGDEHAQSPEAELDEVELNLIRRYEDFSTVGESALKEATSANSDTI